jgi:hypothetical protein
LILSSPSVQGSNAAERLQILPGPAGGWNGSMISQAKGISMHKYKITTIPPAQKAVIYAEGKRAFTEGQQRGYNPYSAHSLARAVIWWNGWDTGKEESAPFQPAKKK